MQFPLRNIHPTGTIYVTAIECVGWDSKVVCYDYTPRDLSRPLSQPMEMGQRSPKLIVLDEPVKLEPGASITLALHYPGTSCAVGINNKPGGANVVEAFKDGNLELDNTKIDDMDIITLCRSLSAGIWQNLGTLSLDNNKIGDKGMQAIAKLLQGKDNLPQLDRLMLRGNPAAKFRVDDVYRQLKARGRGLKQSDAVNNTQSKDKADQRKASRVWEPSGAD